MTDAGESPHDTRDLGAALVGSWHLVRWEIAYPASGRVSTPFGDDAAGLIVYAPDGHMSVVLRRRERLADRRAGAPELSEHDKAFCFSSYMHYAGRWHVEGNDVVHVDRARTASGSRRYPATTPGRVARRRAAAQR